MTLSRMKMTFCQALTETSKTFLGFFGVITIFIAFCHPEKSCLLFDVIKYWISK